MLRRVQSAASRSISRAEYRVSFYLVMCYELRHAWGCVRSKVNYSRQLPFLAISRINIVFPEKKKTYAEVVGQWYNME